MHFCLFIIQFRKCVFSSWFYSKNENLKKLNKKLSLPRYRPLPPSGASFGLLLLNLGTERILSLFYHVLTHQKMLIHTLNMKDLTPCLEALSSMIFPLKWQCPFIPLCPIEMATCIESPMPILMGISTTYFDEKGITFEFFSALWYGKKGFSKEIQNPCKRIGIYTLIGHSK